jgi:hypothetical protein
VAQALLSHGHSWILPLVRENESQQFQVVGVENNVAQTNRLRVLVGGRQILGHATADIGNPRFLAAAKP